MSLEIACDVEGIGEFQAAMERFDGGMQRQVYRFLHSWASDVKVAAMQRAPVRTGYLRSRIYSTIQDWVAQIGAEATYAYFVEFGTRYMLAHPYLAPAIQEYLPELEFNIIGAIEQAKSEAGFE